MMQRYASWLGPIALAAGMLWAAGGSAQTSDQEKLPTEAQQRAAEHAIHEGALRGHIRFLAHDLLEGRGPGSRGDQLTQQYLAAQFESLGLEPAGPNGDWFQPVPLVGISTTAPPTLEVRSNSKSIQLARHDEFVVNSGKPVADARIDDAELVFAGYGMVAPEYDWDDYKDVDVTGKIVVLMNNDPSSDPQLFGGSRRLYYGRWDYKYEMAARKGAAGALIIHTTPSAGYPFQVVQTSWAGENFQLRDDQTPSLTMSGWLTEEATRRVFELVGKNLDELRAAAEQRAFRPVPLGCRMSVSLECTVRETITANVLARLRGSDEQRADELVVYTAHHDHLGLAAERDERGDNIYNGAVDNASGTAALLAIAHAYTRLPQPPPRSILFAAVGAEEQGLLGSKYLAAHPPAPAGRLAAVINIDGVNILGPTLDVNFIGYGKSSLDAIVERIARWQGRIVTPDLFPDRGYYYRSDQFSLAKIGVPGVYLHSGVEVIGKPEGWGREQLEKWTETDYHQPSDEFDASWNLEGAVQDTQLLFYTGLQVAADSQLPAWEPGDEFEAARKQALEAVR